MRIKKRIYTACWLVGKRPVLFLLRRASRKAEKRRYVLEQEAFNKDYDDESD